MTEVQIDDAMTCASNAYDWLENIELPEYDELYIVRDALERAMNAVDTLKTELELIEPDDED